MSFCRIDDKPIRTREPVTEPDALLIQDLTLLLIAGLLVGLGRTVRAQHQPGADLASPSSPPSTWHLLTVPATFAHANLAARCPARPCSAGSPH